MKVINIAFCDFWKGFKPDTQWFYPLIESRYKTRIVSFDENPDLLFFSCFGNQHLFSNAKIKIYFTGENDVPDFNICDYALSFQHIDFGKRHLRLPLYALYPSFDLLRTGSRESASFNRKFCSFVVSNNIIADSTRSEFYEQLSKYKHIDSGGRYANNIGGPVKDKHEFIKNYKFNIAFENSRVDGYTTEKLVDALAAGTLPIYWGNPRVELDFPKECFIDVSDFKTIGECIEYIVKIDNDNNLYSSYFNKNPLENNPFVEWETIFIDYISNILSSQHTYIVTSGVGKHLLDTKIHKERLVRINFFNRNLELFEKVYKIKTRIFH